MGLPCFDNDRLVSNYRFEFIHCFSDVQDFVSASFPHWDAIHDRSVGVAYEKR